MAEFQNLAILPIWRLSGLRIAADSIRMPIQTG